MANCQCSFQLSRTLETCTRLSWPIERDNFQDFWPLAGLPFKIGRKKRKVSELDPSLKGNAAWRVVSSEPYAKQACRG
jgi:hypothetical protein